MDKLTAAQRELLMNRWIEAADVLRRLPPARGPKEFGNAMPDVVHDYADAMMREADREKGEWSWGRTRPQPASAKAISRMWEVTDWSNKYLMNWPRHRRCAPRECLWAFSICSVSGRSFSGVCRRRAWARTTAYARVDQALLIVHNGLIRDNILIHPSDVDYHEQSEQSQRP
jgi:hypothetical protein